jgi:hypothetical protein
VFTTTLRAKIKPKHKIYENCWNKLCVFELSPGNYSLVLKDDGLKADIIADAIRTEDINNPEKFLLPFFYSNKKEVKVYEDVTF